MQFDGRGLSTGHPIHADIAIIGGGLCGLTLARELAADQRLRIVVLESGGTSPDADTEDLNRGTAVIRDAYSNVRRIDDYLVESRCRCLGGSGWLWGGKCAELDPIDFETRRWIEHSGWPFDYAHMKPYFDRACRVMELPAFRRNAQLDAADERSPLMINSERTVSTGLRRHTAIAGRAPQGHFSRFCVDVANLPNVHVYLHSTVVEIATDDGGSRVCKLVVRASHGVTFSVHARTYVLAAGGLENPRLLLTMGRQHDLVGRYFMGHVMHRKTNADSPHNCLVPRVDPSRLALYIDKDPMQLQGVFQLTGNAQKRERLPNCTLTLQASTSTDGSLPVYFMLEQQPQALSRLTLGGETDALGVPRLHLDWRFRESDFSDLRRAAAVFAAEFARHGIGELRYDITERSLIHYLEMVRHHIGTTRMHTLRELGVVNQNCRAHDIDNLYVAGTSVFPTSGISNPTLAILALTMRLADHLQETASAS